MADERKKVLAIINPISGTSNKEKLPRLIESQLDAEAFDVTVRMTERAGHAHEMALAAARQGTHCVIAVGGDGTVNEVASALCDTPTVLAIVPVGSGNGLARHLRLPMNAARALQVVNNWHFETFDYCTVNERPFFCTCGVGFDAQVSRRFSEEGTRGFITYIKTTINEYIHYKAQNYVIDIDGRKVHEQAMVIAACNAAQYGNNAFIAQRASTSPCCTASTWPVPPCSAHACLPATSTATATSASTVASTSSLSASNPMSCTSTATP